MTINKYLLTLLAVFALAACETETGTELQDSIDEVTPETAGEANPTALFDPSNSVIPFPNNLLLLGSTDGTINIPVADPDDLADPQVALNAIDGFSTVAPMSAGFSTAIDDGTISATSVKMYEVALTSGAVSDVISQMVYGVDFVATLSSVDSTQSTLAILPLRPLDAKTSYMVVITDDLKTASGTAFDPSLTYQLIKALPDPSPLTFGDPTLPGSLQLLSAEDFASFDQLRLLVNTGEAVVSSDPDGDQPPVPKIIQSWSFTTQSISDVLVALRDDIITDAVTGYTLDSTIVPAVTTDPGDDNGIVDSPQGAADIYVGTLDVPYFLTASASSTDPTALGSFWQGVGGSNLTQFNTTPVVTSTQSIPIMISIPKPGGMNYPVVIFQHGFTRNRGMMLTVADRLALQGFAVVSIDLPMHGITGNETDGTAPFYQAGQERTFDLDLLDNATRFPGPDGITDTSGTHFVNLSNLLNFLGNGRQAVSDLVTLTYAITSGELTAGTSSFNAARIYFLGHSGGAIVGVPFVNLEDNVREAAFVAGGGYTMKLLDGSASFSPLLINGLAANGVNKGTADYESFLGVAQTVLDSGDGVNYSVDITSTTNRGLLGIEIVGGPTSPSDLTVPNTVPDANDSTGTVPAPLAGTEPQFTLLGLTQINSDDTGSNLKRSVKFVVGNHGSLLSPEADDFNDAATNLAVTTEMQSIIAGFFDSNGSAIDITDDTLLQAPTP